MQLCSCNHGRSDSRRSVFSSVAAFPRRRCIDMERSMPCVPYIGETSRCVSCFRAYGGCLSLLQPPEPIYSNALLRALIFAYVSRARLFPLLLGLPLLSDLYTHRDHVHPRSSDYDSHECSILRHSNYLIDPTTPRTKNDKTASKIR